MLENPLMLSMFLLLSSFTNLLIKTFESRLNAIPELSEDQKHTYLQHNKELIANQLHHLKMVDNKRIELLKYLYSSTRNFIGWRLII